MSRSIPCRAAAVCGLILALAAPSMAGALEDPRPNLLFLLTDDQRFDALSGMGSIVRTPHMDRLVGEGVRFANAFVNCSICAASRATAFTGTVERTHRYTFGTPPLRDELVAASYPVLLRNAGYRTGFIGKLGVKLPAGAADRMFETFVRLDGAPYHEKLADGTVRHLSDRMGDVALRFLEEGDERPFCLSISFRAPHAEDGDERQYLWSPAQDGLYDDITIPAPPLGDPAFFESQPRFLRESLGRVRWFWRFDTPEKYQRMVKGYYRMITGVDAVLGRLRAALDELGLADSTVIVFTSDNGYFLGDRGFAGKWLPYEASLRVPLIVFDPRADAGRRGSVVSATVVNVDLAPTLLDLAGVATPDTMQGRSLVPLLAGDTPEDWRQDFFFEHLFEHAQIPKHEGVRTARYKYARYFEQEPLHEELYDLETDPLETRDLAADPAHHELLERLRRRCDELRDAAGGPFVPHPQR